MTGELTEQEREDVLRKMRQASDGFYLSAVRCGNHSFIEFAGLMNEYIQVCQRASNQGVDFTQCSVHTGQRIYGHEIKYIREKLDCIYGLDVLTAPTR